MSHHATDTAAPGHHWNQVNPGLGIELRKRGVPLTDAGDKWRTVYTAGFFTDSRDYRSAYAGAVLTYELATLGRTRLDGGAGAFIFHRSQSWDGHMRWSPAVLPALSLTDLRTGMGFEILWRPPHTDGPATLYLQLTFLIGPRPAKLPPPPSARPASDLAERFAAQPPHFWKPSWIESHHDILALDSGRAAAVLGGPPAPRLLHAVEAVPPGAAHPGQPE